MRKGRRRNFCNINKKVNYLFQLFFGSGIRYNTKVVERLQHHQEANSLIKTKVLKWVLGEKSALDYFLSHFVHEWVENRY